MIDTKTTFSPTDSVVVTTADVCAARYESSEPSAYRLARRGGELILQGAYLWQEGLLKHGYEWCDIPTVDLESDQ